VEAEAVFAIEWDALTDEERAAIMAVYGEQTAHGTEVLEAIDEDVRVAQALLDLIAASGARPGTTLWQAGALGFIGVMEVVEAIRGAA
jgi:hypothetical protein